MNSEVLNSEFKNVILIFFVEVKVTLPGQVPGVVEGTKYLGVITLSDNLDWSKHNTTTNASARLSFIKSTCIL